MKKFMKFSFVFGAVLVLSLLSVKYIKRFMEFLKLIKTLPEYLRDIVGEKPSLCNYLALPNKLEIKVGLSKEVKEREKDIDKVVMTYIEDFYPLLAEMKVKVEVFEKKTTEKSEEKQKETSDG